MIGFRCKLKNTLASGHSAIFRALWLVNSEMKMYIMTSADDPLKITEGISCCCYPSWISYATLKGL